MIGDMALIVIALSYLANKSYRTLVLYSYPTVENRVDTK